MLISATSDAATLTARIHPSKFPQSHDTYNAMGTGSDGRIYYVLCSALPDVGARMYSFDPASGNIELLGDLTEACGETGLNAIARGKSHVNFVEARGKLFFATHIGFYQIVDDMEKAGLPPAGMKPYRGGHLLSWDMSQSRYGMRMRAYAITWPTGRLLWYDVPTKRWRDLGPFFRDGEHGRGETYRTICRSIAVDPDDGSAYFTVGEGTILRYRYESDSVETVAGCRPAPI